MGMSMADFHRPQDLILVPFLRCRCNTSYSIDGAGHDHVPMCSANKLSFSCSSDFLVVVHLRPATWEIHGMGIANCVHSVHRVSFLFSIPRSIPVQLPPRSFVQYANKEDYYTGFDSQASTEEGLGVAIGGPV